jgi:predicted nuclease with TOPRIM domain
MIKNKEKINFNTVSDASGVSKSYLYKNEDIRDRIERLREQQEGLTSSKQVKTKMTNKSKDVLIAVKNKKIKQLEEEIHTLKNELKRLRGQMYENILDR